MNKRTTLNTLHVCFTEKSPKYKPYTARQICNPLKYINWKFPQDVLKWANHNGTFMFFNLRRKVSDHVCTLTLPKRWLPIGRCLSWSPNHIARRSCEAVSATSHFKHLTHRDERAACIQFSTLKLDSNNRCDAVLCTDQWKLAFLLFKYLQRHEKHFRWRYRWLESPRHMDP